MFTEKMKKLIGALREKNILNRLWKKKIHLSISIFQNLSQINIELWNEILSTQNFYLLDSEHTKEKKYSSNDNKLISDKFSELYDDYFLKLNNSYAKKNLRETQEKIQLSSKIIILTDCVNTLLSIQRNYKVLKNPLDKENEVYKCVKIVSKYVTFGHFNTIDENIAIITKLIQSNQLTYNRQFGEDDEKFEKNTYTFEKQVVDVEQVLGRSIDITKTNVLKWIGYINLAQEISKKRQDGGSKR